MDKSWKFIALGLLFVTLLTASGFIAYILNQQQKFDKGLTKITFGPREI